MDNMYKTAFEENNHRLLDLDNTLLNAISVDSSTSTELDTDPKAMSSKSRREKIAMLSLNKCKKKECPEIQNDQKSVKRQSTDDKIYKSNECKKAKIDGTILKLNSFSTGLDGQSSDDSLFEDEMKPTKEIDAFKDYMNGDTDILCHFEDSPSQCSQFFKDAQVLEQIESVISDNNESNTEIQSENVNPIENLLNQASQFTPESIDAFFNQIEHSIIANDSQNVPEEFIDAVLTYQNINESVEKIPTSLLNDSIINPSLFNCSFNSAIKQTLLANIQKSINLSKRINQSFTQKETKFESKGPFYGLPGKVKELIKTYKGIDELYDWQDECLKLPAVNERRNLIYALPTSGGKTLVAEILMLRELICYQRNALFILPFVAIVQEKVWALSPFGVALDFLIEEYAANKGNYPPRKRRRKHTIYIATIEKALGLVNSLIENDRINELGLIVVDELHLVGEEGRGSTLEGLLTKLMHLNSNIQIIAMSATIGNVADLCKFLNADIYSKNFRPVELTEYVKCGNEIAKINWTNDEDELLTVERKTDFGYSDAVSSVDPDRLGGLVMEVVPEGSCLIFCHSKKNCENVAYLLCRVAYKSLLEHKKTEKAQILQALKKETEIICKVLNVSIPFGIAYHHSGLTNEERRIIEDGFRAGIISVICCTSTLAAGVNLPAQRVILRQPYIGRDFITLSRYKQMVGRAGRAGLGEAGDSILICTAQDLPKVKKLLLSPMDKALSSLHINEARGLRHLILSIISLGLANNRLQLQEIVHKTLLAVHSKQLEVNIKQLTDKVISDLFKLGALKDCNNEMNRNNLLGDITVKMDTSGNFLSESFTCTKDKKRRITIKNDTRLVISKLGCAAIKGNFELSRAHMLYDDLHKAQSSLVLLDALHLLYLVIPYETAEHIKPNKTDYYNILTKLNSSQLQTAKVLGINDSVTIKMLSNQQIKNVPEKVLNRFYLALMLYDLWNEMPIFEVSEKYQINRGIVQNLMTGAATFASNVVNFCEGLEEFWTFAYLLKGINQRLSHCCMRELMPLMELPAVKQSRAKQLYNAGFKSLQSVAKANSDELIEKVEFMPRRTANQLIAAAKMLLLEKVENLRDEAEEVLNGPGNPTLFSTPMK